MTVNGRGPLGSRPTCARPTSSVPPGTTVCRAGLSATRSGCRSWRRALPTRRLPMCCLRAASSAVPRSGRRCCRCPTRSRSRGASGARRCRRAARASRDRQRDNGLGRPRVPRSGHGDRDGRRARDPLRRRHAARHRHRRDVRQPRPRAGDRAARRRPRRVDPRLQRVAGRRGWRASPPPPRSSRSSIEELLPVLVDRLPITDDPSRSVVVGQSLGGLAALWLAHRHPGRFGCAVAQSSSLWWPGGDGQLSGRRRSHRVRRLRSSAPPLRRGGQRGDGGPLRQSPAAAASQRRRRRCDLSRVPRRARLRVLARRDRRRSDRHLRYRTLGADSPTDGRCSLGPVIRRGAMLKMVVIAALAALVTTLVAVLIRWLPESASEEMDRIVFTYWFATIICIGIFALVAARDRLRRLDVPRAAGRRHGRAADPRAHRARDRVDGRARDPRHRDRGRQRRRALEERGRRQRPAQGAGCSRSSSPGGSTTRASVQLGRARHARRPRRSSSRWSRPT